MDIAGSALALVALAPLFLVIAIAIKISSKGPVFFRQKRIGQIRGVFCLPEIPLDACQQRQPASTKNMFAS